MSWSNTVVHVSLACSLADATGFSPLTNLTVSTVGGRRMGRHTAPRTSVFQQILRVAQAFVISHGALEN